MERRLFALAPVALGAVLGSGCAAKIDRFTIDRVVAYGAIQSDIERFCAVGESLGIPLGSATSREPHKALVLADVSAALCLEPMVREAQLDGARARATLEGEAKVAAIKDARYREERAHTAAAYRYKRAWDHLEEVYGEIGQDRCPTIRREDEIVYLMGLYAGLHGMLHDKAGGGHVGVSLDVLGKVARGTACIDNERWWHVPGAFKYAAYATLSNTEDGDPWAKLEAEATDGSASGIRLARAVQVMIAGNADREDDLRHGITAHAASVAAVPANEFWAAMDKYAWDVARHESDLLWTRETGHRTPAFGDLPGGAEPAPSSAPEADPFGDDPFGGGGDDTPAPAGDDGPAPAGSQHQQPQPAPQE